MLQAQQKWAVTPVANAGGYPGSPYFKITIAGTDRALTATKERELTALPGFTGAPGRFPIFQKNRPEGPKRGGPVAGRPHPTGETPITKGWSPSSAA